MKLVTACMMGLASLVTVVGVSALLLFSYVMFLLAWKLLTFRGGLIDSIFGIGFMAGMVILFVVGSLMVVVMLSDAWKEAMPRPPDLPGQWWCDICNKYHATS